MESLWLLVPIAVVIVFLLVGLFAWSLQGGQFDDLEEAGRRVLEEDTDVPPDDEAARQRAAEAGGNPDRPAR